MVLLAASSCDASPFSFNACGGNPGRLPEAKEAFHRFEPVAQSIEAYHRRTGTYPNTLAELVPVDLATIPASPGQLSPLYYHVSANGFSLSFAFTTTCHHTCILSVPESKSWRCDSAM